MKVVHDHDFQASSDLLYYHQLYCLLDYLGVVSRHLSSPCHLTTGGEAGDDGGQELPLTSCPLLHLRAVHGSSHYHLPEIQAMAAALYPEETFLPQGESHSVDLWP